MKSDHRPGHEPDLDAEKLLAAHAAAREVANGMLVGLGTGSSAAYAVRAIAQRVAHGLRVECVATSLRTEALAKSLGLAVIPFDAVASVDLTIDGADEIDASLHAIKGGGGALLREKVVAAASRRVIVVVDSSKLVPRLGTFRLPVEVLPFAGAWVERAIRELGGASTRRLGPDGSPFRTDQQNDIVDVDFGLIRNPPQLAAQLAAVPGVVEHGLFLDEIDEVFIGRHDGVEVLQRPS